MYPFHRAVRRLLRPASGAAWMLAGTAGAALAQYVVVVLLAREVGAEAAGQYALGLAIATPTCLLTAMALRTVLVTDPHGASDFTRYRRLRLVSAGVALAVVAGVAWVLGGQSGQVVAMVGVAKAADSMIDIHIGLWQRVEWMRQAGGCLVVNAVATVTATLVLLTVSPTAMAAAAGSAIGSLVAWFGYGTRVTRSVLATMPGAGSGWPAPHRGAGELARVALPLGLATFIAALAVSVPRYAVAYHLELAALGVFTAIGYVMVTANLVASAVSQALLPGMRRLVEAGRAAHLLRLTWRLVAGSLCVAVVAVVACSAFGAAALRILYGPEYEPYTLALMIVAAASGVSAAVFCIGTALSATRRFSSQLAASVITLVVTTGLAIVLVPHGVVPATWTLLVPLLADGAIKLTMLVRAVGAGSRVGSHRAVGSAA